MNDFQVLRMKTPEDYEDFCREVESYTHKGYDVVAGGFDFAYGQAWAMVTKADKPTTLPSGKALIAEFSAERGQK